MATNAIAPAGSTIGTISTINYIIDGGGSVITSGTNALVEIPYSSSILQWDFMANPSGSITCDVRRDVYANYSGTPFATGLSIVDGSKPTISSGLKAQNTAPTWSGLSAGDMLNFVVDTAPSAVTKATLSIKIQRTS